MNVHTRAVSHLCCVSLFCVCFSMCVNVKGVSLLSLSRSEGSAGKLFSESEYFVCEAVGASGQH
jgi:hypothetical protein